MRDVKNILAEVHMRVEGHQCHIQLKEKQAISHSFEVLDLGCHVGEDTRVINISVETIYKALQEFKAVQKTAKEFYQILLTIQLFPDGLYFMQRESVYLVFL